MHANRILCHMVMARTSGAYANNLPHMLRSNSESEIVRNNEFACVPSDL